MKKQIYLLLPFFIAAALRLYPYFVSGLPFSTDAWSPIRNVELLIEHTPIRLEDKIFGGYNNYWPANSLFGAVVSQVTGIEPMQAMAISLPLTGSIAILIFYVFVKRLYNAKISFMASIIFGTAFTHVYFTAGVTKETYANPLYLFLILIFLHPTISKWKQTLLFTVTAITLALTHHLTPLITIAILSSIALARFINNTKKGLAPNKSDFTLVSILAMVTTLYFGLYAQAGFKFTLTLSDWLSAASYQILTFALAVYLISKPYVHAQTRTLITTLGTTALAPLLLLLAIKIPLAGFPTLPKHCLLYFSPYAMTLPLITLGYGFRKRIKGPLVPLFWLAPLMGLEAYAIFSNSTLSSILWIRIPNFLYAPLAILSAVGLYRLYENVKKPRLQKLIKPAVITIILVIAAINAYTLYASVSLQERYL
jgi:asparagine N-glycosylation enzyme membrane subunit Stt3